MYDFILFDLSFLRLDYLTNQMMFIGISNDGNLYIGNLKRSQVGSIVVLQTFHSINSVTLGFLVSDYGVSFVRWKEIEEDQSGKD